jgi:hypothetical protein
LVIARQLTLTDRATSSVKMNRFSNASMLLMQPPPLPLRAGAARRAGDRASVLLRAVRECRGRSMSKRERVVRPTGKSRPEGT